MNQFFLSCRMEPKIFFTNLSLIMYNFRLRKFPIMNKSILQFLIISGVFYFSVSQSFGQITTDNTMTIEELVNDILLGDGVDAFNITYNGQPAADVVSPHNGYFDATGSNFLIGEGVVMATSAIGFVTGAPGGVIEDNNMNDPDLVAIGFPTMNNCAVIEFDFTVNSDSVVFDYIFASEEYPGFTCSSFNDAFGFFLSGPGIAGPFTNNAINIALIPNSDVPVAINTLNEGLLLNNATCMEANPNYVEDSQYFVPNDPVDPNSIQIQGHTVVLQAREAITCGGTYHIKMAIGNALDQALQSAVFLKKGSFTASGEVFVDVNAELPGIDLTGTDYEGVIVAGCFSPTVQLIRPTGAPVGGIVVEYGGSAVEGVDYVLGENDTLFTFSMGVDTLTFNITTLVNPGATDTVYLEFYVIYEKCDGIDTAFASIPIVPPYILESETEDVVLTCPADSVIISAQGLVGLEPYGYNWGDFGNGQNAFVPVPEDQAYFLVAISDPCAFEILMDSVLVTNNIPPPLEVSIPQPADPLCPNQPVDVEAITSGGNGDYTYIWSEDFPNTNAVTVDEIFTTEIFLTVVDTCGTMVMDSLTIPYPEYDDLTVDFVRPSDNCPDGPLELVANISGGAGDVSYVWSQQGTGEFVTSPTEEMVVIKPAAGKNIYEIQVMDQCNRAGFFGITAGTATYTDSLQVIYLDNVPNVMTPNGDGANDVFIVEGIQEFEDSRLEIFDRWGKLVYESSSYNAGNPLLATSGDGFRAEGLKDGTYFYVINVDKGECVKSGNLQVLGGRE